MDTPFLRAQHYHDQAEKMRKLGAAEEDEESRNALLDLAKVYDRLCQKFLQAGREATKQNP